MKILLMKPVIEKAKRIFAVPPFSLGYLATALRVKHEVEILDCEIENMDEDDLKKFLSNRKYDVIGITCFSHNLEKIRQTLDMIKERDGSIMTVLGGPHVSGVGGRVLDIRNADYAFQGEAEVGLPLFVDALEKGETGNFESIPGLIWRNKDGAVSANPKNFEPDIDRFDFVSWDLIGLEKYFRNAPQGVFLKKRPMASIITTRGCPFNCTYCAAWLNNGKKIRNRSPENIIKEIDLFYGKYGVREIHILDDNFTFNKDFVKKLCKMILARKYDMAFAMPNGVRLDSLDGEMLSLMKKAGWYSLGFGIESGSERILKKIRKGLKKEFVEKKISMIKDMGFNTVGFFIVGFPGETKREMNQTAKFAGQLKLDLASFGNFTPLPGTEVFNELVRNGEIQENFKVSFTSGKVVYSPKGITPKELEKIHRNVIIRYYLNPKRYGSVLRALLKSNVFFILKRLLLILLRQN